MVVVPSGPTSDPPDTADRISSRTCSSSSGPASKCTVTTTESPSTSELVKCSQRHGPSCSQWPHSAVVGADARVREDERLLERRPDSLVELPIRVYLGRLG